MKNKSPASEKEFQGLVRVLDCVTMDRQNRLKSTFKLIGQISDGWNDIKRMEIERNARENHHFNPLRKITIKENDHSRILGELLDPQGSHGQGYLFLDSFLDMIGIELGGSWIVTIEAGRVDIMLRRSQPASVVIIENKAHKATDQHGQLYRYWFDQIHSLHPNLCYESPETARHFKVVYLPPESCSPPAEISLFRPKDAPYQSCAITNLPTGILDCRSFRGDIVTWLKSFDNHAFSPRLKSFLNLYREIWSL